MTDATCDGGEGQRYSRQVALGVIGPQGQEILARSTVAIVGCGALGSHQAALLARAGAGRLILVDRDVPALHNLHRQLLFDEGDVRARLPKVEAAARRLQKINSGIAVETCVTYVTTANVRDLVRRADVLLDGTDNFRTRFLLNDAAVEAGKPWIHGGVLGTRGSVMTVRPGGPCLRCLLPELPDPSRLPTCETVGVLNAAVAWVAALQVAQALRLLVEGPGGEEPRLHALDPWQGTCTSIPIHRREACPCCVERRFDFLPAA